MLVWAAEVLNDGGEPRNSGDEVSLLVTGYAYLNLKHIHDTCKAILDVLLTKYIKVPTKNQAWRLCTGLKKD